MRPKRARFIAGRFACTSDKAAPRCRFESSARSARSGSSISFSRIAPAQCTTVVAGVRDATALTASSVAAASARSTLTDFKRGERNGQSRRERLMTSYPSSRNAPAVANPMPELPPVITTRFTRSLDGIGDSGKELQGGQRRLTVQQFDFLQRDDDFLGAAPQVMPGDARVDLLLVLLIFEVQEGRAQNGDPALRIAAFNPGRLQDVLAPARLGLRVRLGIAQPLDADLEQQLVFVEQRCVLGTLRLAAHQRHPITAVVRIQVVPFVEAFFIDEPRLVVHELDERRVIADRPHHAPPAVIAATQARNCPRMGTSLVPLCVPSMPRPFSRSE